jgi:hypothetical protein
VAGHVLAGGPALEHPGRPGEETDLVDHRGDLLRAGEPQRLTGVLALHGNQLVGPGLERVGDPDQRLLPVAGCAVPPALERLLSRAHGRVDVRGRGDRGLGEHPAGGRVDQVRGPAVGRVDLGAADEVAQRAGLIGHGALLGAGGRYNGERSRPDAGINSAEDARRQIQQNEGL